MKRFLKCCSVLLTLVLLFHMVPLQVFATETATSSFYDETVPAQIVEEVEAYRTEYTKTYRMDNGIFTAAVYNNPVHYMEGTTWQEIDNTLRTMSDGTYANTAGVWDVRFPQQLSEEKAVSITKDGNTLSFYMAGALMAEPEDIGSISTEEQPLTEAATVTINGNAETYLVSSTQTSGAQIQQLETLAAEGVHSQMVLDKNASRLSYEDVYSNTHIRYDLQGNKVKESVILESYQSNLRGYRYILHTGSMVPVLNSDGSIDMYDGEEVVLSMPAPFLVDENQEVSYDVQVALEGKGGMYVLVYLLPEEWLAEEERAWPVVLDPVVIADPDALSNIKDRGVASNATYAIDRVYLECGYSTSSRINQVYIMFSNLPDLFSSDVILGADLMLRRISSTGNGGIPIEAHKVLSTWDSATINWSNKPAIDTKVEDYQIVDGNGYYHWDITDVVRGWYSGKNTGVMLKADAASENATTDNYRQFYSSDTGIVDRMPTLTVYYRNNNGLENYWDYTATSAGRAGTGYVNSFTGNMVWTRGDMGFGGNRMPVSISHVYNLNDAGNNEFGMGNGWRTNLNQKVYRWSKDSNYYVWEDADGTDHYFRYSSGYNFKDEDGLELTLNNGGSGSKSHSITDKNGNVSYFDGYGRLSSIVNNQQTTSSITITYTTTSGFQIKSVKDGAGRVYDFTYSNGLLSKIEYKGSGTTALYTVNYTYSGNNLLTIKDKDGKSSQYSYIAGSSILETIQDVDGYKLQYSYYAPQEDYQPYRVHKIREFSGTTAGGTLTLEYANNQTTFTDANGNIQIVQFNDFGNTVSVQDGEGRAQYAQYLTNDHTEKSRAHQMNLSSKLQNTVGNRLPNSSFENTTTSWYPSGSPGSPYAPSTAAHYLGSKSLALTGNKTAETAAVTVASGETVTFSAYVKGSGIKLQLGSSSSQNAESSTAWTRLQVSYTNTSSGTVSITPKIVSTGTGTGYVDCVQLESAPTASRYNLIQNGDFRDSSAWSKTTGIVTPQNLQAAAPQLNNTVYSLTGNMTATNRVSQTVAVSGGAGDTFVIAGWAKGDSVPTPVAETGQVQRRFAVAATFHYTNGQTKTFYANFNPDTDSSVHWQYAAQAMVAENAYSSVTVELCFDYNANTVYFDGIGLYKETFGNSYAYDSKGNVTSVVDLQNQTTTYEFNTNNDLIKTTQPNGAQMTYEYDGKHNVTKATSSTGVVYTFTYDTYGNNTSVSISGTGSKKLTSSATYGNSGNTLATTTDAAGKVTTYGYNANTNVLEWVQYPEDTAATRTEYTYDAMYRTATAAATTDTGLSQSVQYTYENDLLKTLTTPSTTYTFSYGAFSLRSKIAIGTRTLASYSYDSINHDLQRLDYGNGDRVQYTYDTLGRVTTQTYEDGDTVTYRYDNDGALATVTDSATGRTTTYYYDFIDRLMKYVETGTNFSHSVGYGYDTVNNLTELRETINGVTFTTGFVYDNDNRVKTVTAGNSNRTYTYDAYSRITQRVTKQGTSTVLTQTLGYRDISTTATTAQVATLTNTASGYGKTYTYTYDDNGNILSVSDGTYTTSYVYDTANQLVRENNQQLDKTWTWTYDAAGNILSRKEYAYTTGTLGTPTDTATYGYATSGWKDLLTSYDGFSYSYDTIGNPVYDGIWTYTWEHGRELESQYRIITFTDGKQKDIDISYVYDVNGMRTQKSILSRWFAGTSTAPVEYMTDEQYDYVYNGSSLSQLTVTTETTVGSGSPTTTTENLNFTYDASGTPMTVTHNGTTYYYVTNLQGDVTDILNSAGTAVVSYIYDAWGNIRSTTGTLSATLGKYNPLRYRGYVYDTETGLYYVSSRYYDPEIGRFINADDVDYLGSGSNLTSYNLFAYCGNNPVMGYDPTGHWDWGLFGKVVATAAVVALCLTGVGMIAAAAATAAATSVTAAVTTAVATASISTFCGAVDGAICAEQSGGNWYDGAMAGAIGGSVGALVSSATNPAPGSDSALRMNTLGRAASSYVYDLTYELFDKESIQSSSYTAYAVDVAMDVTLSPMYYYYTGSGYSGSVINGLIDGAVDVFQTIAYFS